MADPIAKATNFSRSSSTESQQWVFLRWAFWSCALVVLVLSLLPGDKLMPTTGWDKADHLLAYAAMGALGVLAWSSRLLLVFFSLLAFGIVIEGLQEMTGYRTAELRDVVAEVIGLAIGVAVGWGLGKLKAAGRDWRRGRDRAELAAVSVASRRAEPGNRG